MATLELTKTGEALSKIFPRHNIRMVSEDCSKVTVESFNTLTINSMSVVAKDFMWDVRCNDTGVVITCTER